MEEILNEILAEIRALRQGLDRLTSDVADLRQEQVKDELLEFKTDINDKVNYLIESQKSLSEVYGTHEMEIRNLRRRPV